MGETDHGLLPESNPVAAPRWRADIERFIQRVRAEIPTHCVILYGSQATGRYTEASDVDIVVIADFPSGGFLNRLGLLTRLNESPAPIQAVGYTPAEFQRMLEDYSVTALDAVAQGLPLFGDEFFAASRAWLEEQERLGLTRGKTSWQLPR